MPTLAEADAPTSTSAAEEIELLPHELDLARGGEHDQPDDDSRIEADGERIDEEAFFERGGPLGLFGYSTLRAVDILRLAILSRLGKI